MNTNEIKNNINDNQKETNTPKPFLNWGALCHHIKTKTMVNGSASFIILTGMEKKSRRKRVVSN